MAKGKFLKKKKSPINGLTFILLLVLAALVVLLFWKASNSTDTTPNTTPSNTTVAPVIPSDAEANTDVPSATQAPTLPTTEATEAPTEAHIIGTASIGITGDMLVHNPMLTGAKQSDGTYDFSGYYKYIKEYYENYDLMIANLEVTLGGEEAGKYVGYPTFNCPDTIIDALKNAGVDMLLTANNHCYDTGHNGFLRTQYVLTENDMLYIGTRPTEDAKNYIVQDVNGVRIGMANFTYESKRNSNGTKYLNGIKVNAEDATLLNSFSYDYLTAFYNEVESMLTEMNDAGADTTILFIHWGDEYQTKPNNMQTKIAQKLCELGVDFIIGGHPHVIQPFTTLTSSSGHKTYCLYSLGNAVSNQRRESLTTVAKPEYTEDGLIFSLEFEKWSDGTVNLIGIDALPTWVDRVISGDERIYTIVPLDLEADWTSYDLGTYKRLNGSYKQTMSLIGKGLNEVREELGLEPKPLTVE